MSITTADERAVVRRVARGRTRVPRRTLTCRRCRRNFMFAAEQQPYWYDPT
ncbi:zinc-ribbon domain containing protein [Virgisporangium aurantiacum]|uniref:zinc-ribbon domain containing protein n=1 Tax=Virgisporangium aurantiacum TaxID=175570 RepID=UPI003570D556